MAGDLRAGKLRPRWRRAAMAGELLRQIGASCDERIGLRPLLSLLCRRRPPLSLSSALASAPDGELTRVRSTRGRRAALAEVDVRWRAGSADPADGEQGDAAVAREPTTLADARRDRRRPLETFSFCETILLCAFFVRDADAEPSWRRSKLLHLLYQSLVAPTIKIF
jgi:hypothetical protein